MIFLLEILPKKENWFMNKNNDQLYKEWLQKAQNDMKAAEILYQEKGPSDTLCFHCHQAVEKYLKGFLVFNHKEFPKTHDLVFLINLCEEVDKDLKKIKKKAAILNRYYIESRYPPEIRVYSRKECQKVFGIAQKLTQFTVNKVISNSRRLPP